MPTANEAFITPAVLRWALKRTNTTPIRLARKLKTTPENIQSWESGDAKPSKRQADKLARALHVPLPYLFLPSEPTDEIPLRDFRTIENRLPDEPSPDLIDLVNDVLAKHDWYKGQLQREGSPERTFVGSYSFDQPPEEIATNISATIGLTLEVRTSAESWQKFLTRLIELVQACGILVMRSGTVGGKTNRSVSTDEFRGFAISDRLAPLVFINASDFQAAQIFTLGHELAHIWLGTTGISNEKLNQPDPSNIEKVCDAIAAELLVPRSTFLDKWAETRANVDSVSRYFRVSSLVTLRRARDLSRITQTDFIELYDREKRKYARSKQSGGNFYNQLLARTTRPFAAAVVAAVNEQRILYSEAASLLNVRVPTIQKISEHLANPPPARKVAT